MHTKLFLHSLTSYLVKSLIMSNKYAYFKEDRYFKIIIFSCVCENYSGLKAKGYGQSFYWCPGTSEDPFLLYTLFQKLRHFRAVHEIGRKNMESPVHVQQHLNMCTSHFESWQTYWKVCLVGHKDDDVCNTHLYHWCL